MSLYSAITDVANSLSGSRYVQFKTQFSELFRATWDEAAPNPYPAVIDFTSFMAQNNSDIEGAIYIWNDFGSDNARGMLTD